MRKIFRLFIVVALSGAATLANAQQPRKVWRIGLFHVCLDHVPPSLPTLREGLKALGYEEGKNIHLDWRNLADEEAALATAKEFIREKVDLIVAFENQTIRATQAATSEIPVVIIHASDPVANGFVRSLSRPGANLTGFSGLADMPGKRMELFKEIVPKLRRVLVLSDPHDPATGPLLSEARSAAVPLKLQLTEKEATTQADVERILGPVKRADADAIFPVSPNLHVKFSSLFVSFASEKRLPLAAHRKEWVEQGALFSYSHDLASVGRAAAPYVDKILKGTKPGDLPVQQPTKFDLVINLKTAKQIGVTIPQSVLYRADKVIK
jgi:putative ABC transport system substrate-binding protein